MNNITNNYNQKRIQTPPVFMATTRQKIYLMKHHLPMENNMYISHPRTMNALNSIKNIAKNVLKTTGIM